MSSRGLLEAALELGTSHEADRGNARSEDRYPRRLRTIVEQARAVCVRIRHPEVEPALVWVAGQGQEVNQPDVQAVGVDVGRRRVMEQTGVLELRAGDDRNVS